MFKKFKQFIVEGSERRTKPDPSTLHPKCDRCGADETKCKCHEEDYYDANLDHYTPNGETKKGNFHGKS